MINSNQFGRGPISLHEWGIRPNDWLNLRGYPPHTHIEAVHAINGHAPAWLGEQPATAPAQPQVAPPQPTIGFDDSAILNEMINGIKAKVAKSKNPNKLYNIPFYDAFRHRLTRTDGEIGLEIEAEGMNLFSTPIQYWVGKGDGSLRAVKDHPPIEYVLRKPIHRNEVPKALSYLTKKLKESGSSIVESHRTSVHVHVNCQELTVKQIYQYWCLYTIFEEMLVEFSGPDRPGNLFCLSSKQAEYAVNCLESAIQTENFNEVFNDNLRYTSCNMASLGKFGSMEFRSMRGTVDQDLIQVWVDIILLLRDEALKYDCPRSIVEDFTKLGPDAFLYKIFHTRPDIRGIFLSRPLADRNKSMWEGLRLMKDVAYAIKWDKRIIEDKKKESPEKVLNPEYSGYWDYQPVEHIAEEVFLMYSEENEHHRVVNFGQTETIFTWKHHGECHFSPRRFWGYDLETEQFRGMGYAGAISEEHYGPEV